MPPPYTKTTLLSFAAGITVSHIGIYFLTRISIPAIINNAMLALSMCIFVTTIAWFLTGAWIYYRRGTTEVRAEVILAGDDGDEGDEARD